MTLLIGFVSSLLHPYLLLLTALLIALVLQWLKSYKHKSNKPVLLSIIFAVIVAASMPITGHYALGTLEWQYSSKKPEVSSDSVIVVLGGYASRPEDPNTPVRLGIDSINRCYHVLDLVQEQHPSAIICSGGKVDASSQGPSLALLMKQFLISQSVREQSILTEETSTSTFENARETAALLRELGVNHIILVTDAAHIPRAKRCFEYFGIEVEPSGCAWSEHPQGISCIVPSLYAFLDLERVTHEWLGLVWYRVSGKL